MPRNIVLDRCRDLAAVLVVGIFMFPLLWWGLTSIKPNSAIFDPVDLILFGFVPTLMHYATILNDPAADSLGFVKAVLDTIVVALGSTALSIGLGAPAAFGLSGFAFGGRRLLQQGIVMLRIAPPIALVVPLVAMFHGMGLLDTRLGLILAHTMLNLPIAVIILKSYFDELPREIGDAAAIDGASKVQFFYRILLPLSRNGIAATAVLCFIFSWTEFLFAVFLTSFVRTLPVKLSIVSEFSWGLTAALSVISIIPGFIFILAVQRHLVRGLTLGQLKE